MLESSSQQSSEQIQERKMAKFVPVKKQNDNLDFEVNDTAKGRKDDAYDSSSGDERIPLYLAIVFKNQKSAIKAMLTDGITSIMTKFASESDNLQSSCDSLLKLASSGKKQKDGWRFTPDFHVTCAFLDRDEDKADLSPVYRTFIEDEDIDVSIKAIVIVPGKIVTGICFPNQKIQQVENQCPHVTLAVNEWSAKHSNSVLEKTCLKENMSFYSAYQALKRGKAVPQGKDLLIATKVKIPGETASVAAYMVTLPQEVRLRGVTKAEY